MFDIIWRTLCWCLMSINDADQNILVEQLAMIERLNTENAELRLMHENGLSDHERITFLNRIEEKDSEIQTLRNYAESMRKTNKQMAENYFTQLCMANHEIDGLKRADKEQRLCLWHSFP